MGSVCVIRPCPPLPPLPNLVLRGSDHARAEGKPALVCEHTESSKIVYPRHSHSPDLFLRILLALHRMNHRSRTVRRRLFGVKTTTSRRQVEEKSPHDAAGPNQ